MELQFDNYCWTALLGGSKRYFSNGKVKKTPGS